MNGFNVLHAMGYDAFGLPAEQYAVQTGQHPLVTTERNVFEARTKKLAQDIDVLAQQEKRQRDTLELLSRELDLTRKLYQQKVVPEIEMLRLDRQATDLKGQLAETRSRLANVRAATDELLVLLHNLEQRPSSVIFSKTPKPLSELEKPNRVGAPVYGPAAGALIEAYRTAHADVSLSGVPEVEKQ